MTNTQLTSALEAGGLKVSQAGAVLTVWLARPDSRNAQTPAMWRALTLVAQSVADDVSVVLIRGEGASFSAGLDRRMFADGLPDEPSLASMAERTPDEFSALVDVFQQGFATWRKIRPTVIAVVHGYAIGAGFQLALAADMVIAAHDAMFCMKETQLGLVPDLAGTLPLANAVGYPRAYEICATGRFVSAEEAVDIGIAARCVPTDTLEESVDEFVASLLSAPGGALADLKRVLRDVHLRDLDQQREVERRAQYNRIVELAALFK